MSLLIDNQMSGKPDGQQIQTFFESCLTDDVLEHMEGFIPQPQPKQFQCSECLLYFGKVYKCSRCKKVCYCSKECQINAWKDYHSMECGKMQVVPIKGKGLGVVALREIKKGEVICEDMELLTIFPHMYNPDNIKKQIMDLSDSNKRKLMSLSGGDSDDKYKLGWKIVNNFSEGPRSSKIVYYTHSRFNHSCIPNVCLDTITPRDEGEGTPCIAIRNIHEGEELCVSYLANTALFRTRAERQQALRSPGADFSCSCPVCGLVELELRDSDNNRRELRALEDKLLASPDREEIIQLLKRKNELKYKEESYGQHLL